MSFPFLILCLAAAVFACVAMAVAVWARRDDPTIRAFLLLAVGAAVWCAGRIMEISAIELSSRILWAKLQYIGILMVPLGWLLAMVRVSRPNLVIPRAMYSIPLAISLAMLALVFTNESHGLIWRTVRVVSEGEPPFVLFEHGSGYPVIAAYGYGLLAISLYFLATAKTPNRNLKPVARRVLMIGLLLPVCAHIAYLNRWTFAAGGDLTPATFSMMAGLLWFFALRPHLDDVAHYARMHVFGALHEGCVIVDAKGVIVDFNAAARRLLPDLARGKDAPEPWLGPRPAAPEGADYEVNAETVRNLDDRAIGNLVFLRDVRDYRSRENALVLENSTLAGRLNETVEKLSRIEGDLYRDPLTGLFNRRLFQREAAARVSDAYARGERVGLLLIDIDYFKQYNDVYGHVRGDECLTSVAAAIAGAVTGTRGVCARVGGEEFAIILPGSSRTETRAVGLRALHAVRNLSAPHAGAAASTPIVTVSVGAICEVPQAAAFEGLLGKADSAMYAAKRGGRNQFVMGGQPNVG